VSLWRRPLTHTVSKALASSRKTAPVSRLSSKFLLAPSTRRASCRVVLCIESELKLLVVQQSAIPYFPKNCSQQDLLKCLTTVSRKSIGLYEDGSLGSFLGFSMGTTTACFQPGCQYCVHRTPLNNFVRKVMARLGRCLRTLFGIPFGPGALPSFSPMMACRTSVGAVNIGSFVGAYSHAHIATSTISVNAGSDGSSTCWN
jgi:hypothetical protein